VVRPETCDCRFRSCARSNAVVYSLHKTRTIHKYHNTGTFNLISSQLHAPKWSL